MSSPAREAPDDAALWRRHWAARWAPSGARDLVVLGLAASSASVLGFVLGAAPGVHPAAVGVDELVEWVVRVTVTTFVGGGTTMLVIATWTRREVSRRWLLLAVMWLAYDGTLWWVHLTGAFGLAWLVLLPTLYVAMTFRVLATSLFGLLVGAAALGMSPSEEAARTFDAVLPLSNVMDLLVTVSVLVALSVALLDEARQELLRTLDRVNVRTRRSLTALQTLFESMSDGFIVVGPDLDIRFHNSAAELLLGRPVPRGRPASWVEHFGLVHADGRVLSDDELLDTEYIAVEREGQRRVLRQRVVPLTARPEDGTMVSFADVTDQQEQLDELRGFAAVVAHDLRGPLTSLEGWLEMADEALGSRHPDEAVGLLVRARASGHRMREVIEDWLAYAVERQGSLQATAFPLADTVRSLVDERQEHGSQVFEVDAPHWVYADQGLVRQLLDNVVGNAAKYTRPGEVPHVCVLSRLDPEGWVAVDVVDHGIGIPVGEEERIFQEYHRVRAHAAHYEGKGLGLAVCRRIVERHGGRISARNNQHGGTTISFTLPSAPGAP